MHPQLLPAAPPVVALGFSLEVIAIFTAVVALSVYADLWAHRDGREITLRNAAAWSALWIGLALGFGGYL
jgi:tellurite resistance protein TerC